MVQWHPRGRTWDGSSIRADGMDGTVDPSTGCTTPAGPALGFVRFGQARAGGVERAVVEHLPGGGTRIARIAEGAECLGVDVVVLQEVTKRRYEELAQQLSHAGFVFQVDRIAHATSTDRYTVLIASRQPLAVGEQRGPDVCAGRFVHEVAGDGAHRDRRPPRSDRRSFRNRLLRRSVSAARCAGASDRHPLR